MKRITLFPHSLDQVPDDQTIHDQHDQPREREAMEEFVELQRHQQRRADDRQVLRPVLVHQQSDALDREERGVDEGAGAERAELFRRHVEDLFEDGMDVAIVGVETQDLRPVDRGGGEIAMEEMDGAKADRE